MFCIFSVGLLSGLFCRRRVVGREQREPWEGWRDVPCPTPSSSLRPLTRASWRSGSWSGGSRGRSGVFGVLGAAGVCLGLAPVDASSVSHFRKKVEAPIATPHWCAFGLPAPLLAVHSAASLALAHSDHAQTSNQRLSIASPSSANPTEPTCTAHPSTHPHRIIPHAVAATVTHSAARWPNGKAPDFGSGDCAFEPHVGRVTFFWLNHSVK